MRFIPYAEIYIPESTAIQAALRDGTALYVTSGTTLYKYDLSDPQSPQLLKTAELSAGHSGETDYIRSGSAHVTAIVDLGNFLALSLRDSSGGVTNMADGAIVGALSVVRKDTLERVTELNFENKVTHITRYKDLLIVSLHFHGFYIYKLTGDSTVLSCIYKYVETEKPRSASIREFQNSAVFEMEDGKINIAMASYSYGITVYTYDLAKNCITPRAELSPKVLPPLQDAPPKGKNKVFGLTAKGRFVYGGVSPGNNLFREQYKELDWEKLDQRGILYGPHDRLTEEYYHLPLPAQDKPAFIGVIAGDPAPSFLCVAEDHLLFNLDKQGLGIAKIEADGKLTYVGRELEDSEGRQLTHCLCFDGDYLFAAYKMPVADPAKPPVLRLFCLQPNE